MKKKEMAFAFVAVACLGIGLTTLAFKGFFPDRYVVVKGSALSPILVRDIYTVYLKSGVDGVEDLCQRSMRIYGSYYSCSTYKEWSDNTVQEVATVSLYANAADAATVDDYRSYVQQHVRKGANHYEADAFFAYDPGYHDRLAKLARPVRLISFVLESRQ